MSALNGMIKAVGVALAAVTTKTLLQLVAPANQRLRVKEISVSFRGVVNTDTPVLVELLYQATAGTSSALTPVKEDDSAAETLQATARDTVTVEPTAGNVIRCWEIHPQSGMVYTLPVGDEIVVGGGKRLGLRATAPETQTVSAYLRFEE